MAMATAGPGIRGLNHVTLSVRDVVRSIDFYCNVLGFALRARWPTGAYLDAGSLWLCLAQAPAPVPASDYTHLAFDVADADFPALAARVLAAAPIWQDNRSEGASLYFTDPDGHRLELHVGTLASRLAHPPAGTVRHDR